MNVTLQTQVPAPASAPAPAPSPSQAPVAPGDRVTVTAPAPAPASPPASNSEPGVLIPWIQRGARALLAVGGGLAGAVAGGAAGVVIGAAMGASSGVLGKHHPWTCMLHPMENVAGLAALPAHDAAEKLASRLAGDRIGGVVGSMAGGVAGLVTGGLIGALGVAWAGVDAGARTGARVASHLFGDAPSSDRPTSGKTYERGFLDKQIPEPTGEIDQTSHHWFYIKNGMEVLKNDAACDAGLARIHTFLTSDSRYVDILHNGAWDLDTFLGSVADGISISTFHHFGEPFMPGFKAAEWQCRQAWDAACDAWKSGDREKAIYYLGAAVHIPQDLSLPQHAVPGVTYIGKMVGHQMMEGYLEKHFDQAVVDRGGRYFADCSTPEEFCRRVASEATAQYKDAVKEAWEYVGWAQEKGVDPMNPPQQGQQPEFALKAYKDAGERAQRITPGFVEMFFREMEKQGYPI